MVNLLHQHQLRCHQSPPVVAVAPSSPPAVVVAPSTQERPTKTSKFDDTLLVGNLGDRAWMAAVLAALKRHAGDGPLFGELSDELPGELLSELLRGSPLLGRALG